MAKDSFDKGSVKVSNSETAVSSLQQLTDSDQVLGDLDVCLYSCGLRIMNIRPGFCKMGVSVMSKNLRPKSHCLNNAEGTRQCVAASGDSVPAFH